jgi:uncharacterized membrane protein
VAVALVATAALFLPLRGGVPKAADLPDHLGTTAQFLQSLRHGDLYPRWMPDFHDGMGEPTLVYYPPGLYAIASCLAWAAGGDVLFGLFATLALFAFAGSLGMFALLQRRFGDLAATCGGLLFAALPYRVFELYASGLYSAFTAGSLLPWVFAALARESELEPAGSGRFRLGLPLLFAAVVLLNLPTALLLFYLVGIWLAVEMLSTRRWRLARRVVIAMAAGMLLAGVYLIPATLEISEIQIPMNARAVYTSNFLFQGGQSWMSSGLRSMFDRMALFPAVALALGSTVLWFAGRRSEPAAWPSESMRLLLAIGAASFFLMTPISLPLWKSLPALRQVNLPWRLLEPFGTVCVAVTSAALTLLLRARAIPMAVRAAGTLAILAVVLVWGVFATSISGINGKLSAGAARGAIAQFARMVPRGSFLAPGARPIAELGQVPLLACDGPCKARVLEWSGTQRRFEVEAPAGTQLAVRSYFFPGWSARRAGDNSVPLTTFAEPGTGRIVIQVPPGRTEIQLRFGTVPVRVLGWCVSIASLVGLLLLWIRSQRSVSPLEI